MFSYTEKGEIKERFVMFNEGLDQIIAIKKDGQKIEIFDTMSVKEMDDCVRSCTTQAFSKSHGLFTKSKYYIILILLITHFY